MHIPRILGRFAVAVTASVLAAVGLAAPAGAAVQTPGIDVSHYQGTINWTSVRNAGIQFAYIKATEGIGYKDTKFNTYYPAAYHAGVIRGAYHFALPDRSTGAAQADFLVDNGGAWSRDNLTLPAALDIEYNPYGATCYGKSASAMVAWINDFLARYQARTGRWAVLYSTTNWWQTCTGNYSGFANRSPLWLARYASAPGTLPAGWPVYTIWQYSSTGSVAGIAGNVDRNNFNGDRGRLLALANNT
ncbi:lysozyme [Longispora sp. NPDC051575]|uniref:lysozyme n=1 Tax=Longispora sp. NPDC051575 TaxID=3154943 RepID=UPI00343B39D0